MKTFKQIRESSTRVAVITFGRFNPPTIGHQKMIDKITAIAKRYGGDPYLFVSSTQDAKKNPLPYDEKMALMRKMFPVRGYNLFKYSAFKLSTVMFAATKLFEDGYEELIMVVGSDRIKQFRKLLNNYNGVAGRPHGFYNFQKITIESAGERDIDADGAEGMSASKLRQFAIDGDYQSFAGGIPDTINEKDKRDVYQKLRKYMRLRVIEQMIRPIKQKVNNSIEKNTNLTKHFDIIVEHLNQLPYQGHEKLYIDKACNYIELMQETKNYVEVKNCVEKIKSYINILEEHSGMVNFAVCDLALFDNYLEQCDRQKYIMKPLNEKLQQYTLEELGTYEKLALATAGAMLLKYGYKKFIKQKFSVKAKIKALDDKIEKLKDKKGKIEDPVARAKLAQTIAKIEDEKSKLRLKVKTLNKEIEAAKTRSSESSEKKGSDDKKKDTKDAGEAKIRDRISDLQDKKEDIDDDIKKVEKSGESSSGGERDILKNRRDELNKKKKDILKAILKLREGLPKKVKEQADSEKADTVIKQDKKVSDFKKDPKIKKKEDDEKEKEKEKEPEPEPDDDQSTEPDDDQDDFDVKDTGSKSDDDEEDDDEEDEQKVQLKQTFKKYIKGNKEN